MKTTQKAGSLAHVAPAHIEAVLLAHSRVRDVAVTRRLGLRPARLLSRTHKKKESRKHGPRLVLRLLTVVTLQLSQLTSMLSVSVSDAEIEIEITDL